LLVNAIYEFIYPSLPSGFILCCFGLLVRALPLFDATTPRRYARSDARDGDATSVDIRTRHPAPERRAFASACTIFRA
jgi:hypothetical protein